MLIFFHHEDLPRTGRRLPRANSVDESGGIRTLSTWVYNVSTLSELPANRDLGYVKAGLASAEIHAGALFSNLPWSLSVRSFVD
jgi:hypothetical protein